MVRFYLKKYQNFKTFHIIDEEFSAHARTVAIRGLFDEKRTAAIIRKNLCNALCYFQCVDRFWEQCVTISENGPKMSRSEGIGMVFNLLACAYCGTLALTVTRDVSGTGNHHLTPIFFRPFHHMAKNSTIW